MLNKHIAIYLPSLAGGGAELSMLRLAEEFAASGYSVDLVVNRRHGPYTQRIPPNVRMVELQRCRRHYARWLALKAQPGAVLALALPVLLARKPIMELRYLADLASYLKREAPDVMVSALSEANLLSIWARALTGVKTRIVISERTTISMRIAEEVTLKPGPRWRWRFLPGLLGRCYPSADSIVAISDGVAEDLSTVSGIAPTMIKRIYNPVVCDKLVTLSQEPLDHAWFGVGEPPVILAVGKLSPGKGFSFLIRAFARVRGKRAARLLILGEGEQRKRLAEQITELGIASEVAMLGWVNNPYRYMARSAVTVVSSTYEGLSRVLIEAMACGCPVVSTDCPYGPREVLDHGRYGTLVPVGDARAMAGAMVKALGSPRNCRLLEGRAGEFSVRASASQYLELMWPLKKSQERSWAKSKPLRSRFHL